MECAVGTDDIKIVPQGCKPVSVDRCASGFMAPAENVSFPENALETCCKCKEGETCPYCLEKECKDWEKKKYVTSKDCFQNATTPPPTSAPPTSEPPTSEKKDEIPEWVFHTGLVILLILLIVAFAYFRT